MRGLVVGALGTIVTACTPAGAADEHAWSPDTSSTGPTSTGRAEEDSGTDGSSTADDSDASGDTGTDGTTGDPPEPAGPARYGLTVHSPITADVAASLAAIRAVDPGLADDVFMKAGASSDVSVANLHCFATDEIDLGAHAELGATLDVFLAGDAAGTTPFDRDSLATEAGRTASWAIDGDPAPLQLELDAVAPSLAFIHFGTNDMELGIDPGAALPGFHTALAELLDRLEQRGVVAIVVGLTRRGDDPDADRWIATYNAVLRAMAQQRQVPFVDAHRAIDPLPGHGLGPDGLHLESSPDGACIFTEDGLQHGYNMRNLIQLEVLDRVTAALDEEPPDADDGLPVLDGSGTAALPWTIDALPFVHDADTTDAESLVDVYDCGASDESGPERTYALTLTEDTAVRIVALDREGVDIDVHVISSPSSTCTARDDGLVSGTLAAGAWRIVVDTWADGASDYPGRFVLAVVPCEDEDPDCAAALGA
ncbi:MAG: SGNH/GDSL hydrolase family protein [Myxococcales bacterium]|nr:SGNH/GDSL hydrolase family protein [Myxococcales bacterium]